MKRILLSMLVALPLCANAQAWLIHKKSGTLRFDMSEVDSITIEPSIYTIPLTFKGVIGADDNDGSSSAKFSGSGKGNRGILWSDGDKINVFDGDSKRCDFSLSAGADSKSGTFSGSVTKTSETYCALYPSQSTAAGTATGELSVITLPTLQKAEVGTCDPDVCLMMGVSNSNNVFTFKNICSYFRIVPTEALKSVTIESVGGPNITGTVKVSYNNGAPSCESTSITGTTQSNRVVLVGDMAAGSEYFIVVLPCQFAAGQLRVSYQTASGKYRTITYNAALTLSASKFTDISAAFATAATDEIFVDLGLKSGTKWAKCNLGATTPTEVGGLYAWGEIAALGESDFNNSFSIEYSGTATKTVFNWLSYKWSDYSQIETVSEYHMIKYSSKYAEGYSGGDSYTDLLPKDDAAYQATKGLACIPTSAQIQELIGCCNWTYTENYNQSGVNGYIVSSTKEGNSNSIFIPFSGFINDGTSKGIGDTGYYWSSTVYNEPNGGTCYYERARDLQLTKVGDVDTHTLSSDNRRGGQCIRPVMVKAAE